jgi:hypothetical protein
VLKGPDTDEKEIRQKKSARNPQKNFNENSSNYFEEETDVTGTPPPHVRYTAIV